MLRGEQHVVQTSSDVNLLEPHGQKWEVLDAGTRLSASHSSTGHE